MRWLLDVSLSITNSLIHAPQAALEIMPKNPRNFNVDSVRIVKILGASIHDSTVVKGMVFGRSPDSMLVLSIVDFLSTILAYTFIFL